MAAKHPAESWLKVTADGLYCVPGDFFIDPVRPKPCAVVTHGHADHARPGNDRVLATPGTAAIMCARYGDQAGRRLDTADYGQRLKLGDVTVWFAPAGHVLGSAQAVLEHRGTRVVVSGDYKRRADPTCTAFEPVQADVFITEATFGLPVFRHPPVVHEIDKLLASMTRFPERTHLVGAYALGKCQRVIAELRRAGYHRPIWIHGALKALCGLYQREGIELGPLEDATAAAKADLVGELVLAPPSALKDRWSRRLADPVTAMASGWMGVRQRAKQRLVELPLIISDHADWDELTRTVQDVAAGTVWVTHGREEALVHWATTHGFEAKALSLVGFEEEAE